MGLKNFGFIDNSFVVEMREKFLASETYQNQKDLFHPEDIRKIIEDDWYIKRFIIAAYKNIDEAVKLMSTAMQWRKEQGLHELKDSDFPREFFETGGLFQYEADVNGAPSLIMRLKFLKRVPELIEHMKLFCMYQIFLIDEMQNGAGWVLVLDFTDCGYSHYQNIDLLHYFITTMHTNFPAGIDYVLAVDVPWVLSSFWGLVRMWIPEKRRNMVQFCSKADLNKFFDPANLPLVLGGTCSRKYKFYPKECRSAYDMAQEIGLPQERCDEILAEYEPLLLECAEEEEA